MGPDLHRPMVHDAQPDAMNTPTNPMPGTCPEGPPRSPALRPARNKFSPKVPQTPSSGIFLAFMNHFFLRLDQKTSAMGFFC